MDNFNFIKDREVVFETDKKVLIGKLFFIDKKGTYIIFRYVQNFSDNKLISKGNMTFYKPEIKSIRYFSSSSSSDVTTTSDIQPNDNVLDTAITLKNIIIDEPINKDNENIENSITKSFLQLDDMIRINHSVAHVKYITKIDSTYHDAIRDVKNQYEIGVNIEGNVHKFGRAHIALIAISTLSNIYLFDILWLGRVPELKAVFTNKRIEKIIHNSRRFTNIIQFQNVFDTMVAHAATDKIHRMLSIQECVAVNFDLPDCFINVPKVSLFFLHFIEHSKIYIFFRTLILLLVQLLINFVKLLLKMLHTFFYCKNISHVR